MRRSIGSVLFVLLATSGALVITATPASATSWGTAVFTGTATAGPLSSPVGSGCGGTVIAGPVEACPSSSGEGWSFATGFGLGSGVYNGVPVGPVFSAAVVGQFTGGSWCGASSGAFGTGMASMPRTVDGVGTINPSWVLSDIGWVQSAGSVIPYRGTASETGQSGVIFGVVSAIPPNPVTGGGSCVVGTATTFIVVGYATIFVP